MPDAQNVGLGLLAGTQALLLPAVTVLMLAMHAGFAFLGAGSARLSSQVSALSTILVGLAVSSVAYVLLGYTLAHGGGVLAGARGLSGGVEGVGLAGLLLLAVVAAVVPAIVSGAIAERARLLPQCAATVLIVALAYPLLEGIVWNRAYGLQERLFKGWLGAELHDLAGSVVVHAFGGWVALAAARRLGPRLGRFYKAGSAGFAPSSMPLLVLGCWLLCIGWLGFSVMSAPSSPPVGGLVAVNALMAMSGGILAALIAGDGDAVLLHKGALAGLVAIGAGADVVHPVGALLTGGVAGLILVCGLAVIGDPRWQLDDAVGVWPLHGLCGLWGGIACGILGLTAFGGMGGVSFGAQLAGSVLAVAYGLLAGTIVYALVDILLGLRLAAEDERQGPDVAIHKIGASPAPDARVGGA
jgi:Amt family ammonium transporter